MNQLTKPFTILIAEDDAINYRFLETILVREGIVPVRAFDGLEAVSKVNSNPDISLVLMDITMPKMDGLEATRLIRLFNKTIPIIAQTAHSFTEDHERAVEAGCTYYICKPINRYKLIMLIERYTSWQSSNISNEAKKI